MPTHVETLNERELLKGMGLDPVSAWPPRCTWYRQDGSVVGKLPCDPYSRLLYMGRGFRPDVADVSSRHKVYQNHIFHERHLHFVCYKLINNLYVS